MSNIKKLALSDFLAGMSKLPEEVSIKIGHENMFSYPLLSFYNDMDRHKGIFIINEDVYDKVIASVNNIYFFNECNDNESIIIFDPIIDIKRKDDNYTVFYYPDHIINLTLRKQNVKEDLFKEDTES